MSTRERLRTTLLQMLEEEMGESYPELTDDQDLRETLNLDSVDVVGLVMRIEREFRIRLATEELATVKRVGDLLDLMETKLAATSDDSASTTVSTGPEPGPGEPATRSMIARPLPQQDDRHSGRDQERAEPPGGPTSSRR